MKVGMIGLGKLGLPCLLAMERHGKHEVFGYDASIQVCENIKSKNVEYWEKGVNEYLVRSNITVVDSIDKLVEVCSIIFIAVQTPHDPLFEGRTPVPDVRKDFYYGNLVKVANEISNSLEKNHTKDPIIVVISTVLPGTMRNQILPILKSNRPNIRFAYNPYFIAMGTTIDDFLNPEFILIGAEDDSVKDELKVFYSFLDKSITQVMQIESAELTKVAYNTFIGFKITFANLIAEITDKRGGDADEVTHALSVAEKRIMSGAYMRSGMGDGGGCHPRDQIAMSWLAQELDLSSDIFGFLAKSRDSQTEMFARLLISESKNVSLPVCILGVAYKPDSPLDVGSPARLLEYFVRTKFHMDCKIFDPWIYPDIELPKKPHVFFLGVMHSEFKDIKLPDNSVLIDPFGFVEKKNMKVKYIRIGRK